MYGLKPTQSEHQEIFDKFIKSTCGSTIKQEPRLPNITERKSYGNDGSLSFQQLVNHGKKILLG